MIVATTPSRRHTPISWLLAAIAAAAGSLLAAAAVYRLQEYSAAVAVLAILLALAVWRPRLGVYAIAFLALALEGDATVNDPVMHWGWVSQTSIASWSPFGFLVITPLELLVVVTLLAVVGRMIVLREQLLPNGLIYPLLTFFVLVGISLTYGLSQHGRINTALWEIRPLLVCGAIAVIVPTVLPKRRHVERLFTIICLGSVLLSIDIIIRRFTVLSSLHSGQFDLAYDHDSPFVLNIVTIYAIARVVWPGKRGRSWWWFAIPLLIYAEMVTERRAGWIGLYAGLLVIAASTIRYKRKIFFASVLPLGIVLLAYGAAFWSSSSVAAQPVRAVRSLITPDQRDQSSDLYRLLEKNNIRLNIHDHPLTGVGFGRSYTFHIPMPDLSWWPFWHYETHNSLLWLWMEMGVLGFGAFMALVGIATIRGMHLLHGGPERGDSALIVTLVSALFMVCTFSYVDLGVTSPRVGVMLGLVFGVLGAWLASKRLSVASED